MCTITLLIISFLEWEVKKKIGTFSQIKKRIMPEEPKVPEAVIPQLSPEPKDTINLGDLATNVGLDIVHDREEAIRSTMRKIYFKELSLIAEVKKDRKKLLESEQKLKFTQEKITAIRNGDWSVLAKAEKDEKGTEKPENKPESKEE